MSLDIARKDTICALSSAQGHGAIAIVRASGPQAERIFARIFKKNRGEIKPFMAMHGDVVDETGEVIDDVMAIFFPGSRSFTGEPSFEIHCHGNQLIVEQILQALCAMGARLAEPGEFSMRAMLNGKIDLAQAESIADLIHAKSELAKRVALKGVKGGLKEKTENVREIIISVLAEIEARMDFPDEDLGGYDRKHLIEKIALAISTLTGLLANAHHALKLHEGARVVICGRPNAGKSTLLNRLCGEERAIVHETAGTTRDVIEAHMVIDGVPVVLVDVAGLREAPESEPIERIGIERAIFELTRAQLIIWLADCTVKDPFGDRMIGDTLKDIDVTVIRVLNKAELREDALAVHDGFAISAKMGLGISDLLGELQRRLLGKISEASEMFITRARQRDELNSALVSLREAHVAMSLGMVDEVVTSELRQAGLAFDRLFGTELSEDILDRIFSEFCIGK